jgi:hypothetical protein
MDFFWGRMARIYSFKRRKRKTIPASGTLDSALEAPVGLAPMIDPSRHNCGNVQPHGFEELSHPCGNAVRTLRRPGGAPNATPSRGVIGKGSGPPDRWANSAQMESRGDVARVCHRDDLSQG